MQKIHLFSLSYLAWLGGILLFLSSCGSSDNHSEQTQTNQTSQDSSKKYFEHQVSVKYAQNFQVEYHHNYKVVKLLKPFQDTKDIIRFVLVQRGTPAPKGFKKTEIIEIPVQKMIALSHTQVAFIQELGEINSVQGVATPQYSTNPTLIKKHEQNQLVVASTGMELNNENILAAQPNLVMASGMVSGSYKQYQVLLNTSIPVVINSEWLEKTPLGRAEWIKFMALFYNREKEANTKFKKIAQEYQQLKKLAQNVETRPKVVVGLPFKDTWYMPKGGSFVGQFLKDSGADYYWKNEEGVGSMPLDFEAVYGKAQGADFWLVSGSSKNLQEIIQKDARFGDFAAFKNQRVYNNNKQTTPKGVNVFFNTSLIYPNWVLADLIKILHPKLLPNHQWVYYQKLP